MQDWVEDIVAGSGYGSADEYVRSLIQEDQRRRAKDDLDACLLKALDEGETSELTTEDWTNLREKVRSGLANP